MGLAISASAAPSNPVVAGTSSLTINNSGAIRNTNSTVTFTNVIMNPKFSDALALQKMSLTNGLLLGLATTNDMVIYYSGTNVNSNTNKVLSVFDGLYHNDFIMNWWPTHGEGGLSPEMVFTSRGSIAIGCGYGLPTATFRGLQIGVGVSHMYQYMQSEASAGMTLSTSVPLLFNCKFYTNGSWYLTGGIKADSDGQYYPGMYGRATSYTGEGEIVFVDSFDTTYANWTNQADPRFKVRISPNSAKGGISVRGTVIVDNETGVSTNYALPSGNILRFKGGVLTSLASYSWDIDASNYLAFIGNPISTTNTIATTLNTLVVNAKAHGWWNSCDAIYPLVGGSSNTMCWNLKNTNNFKLIGINAPAAIWATNGLVGDGTGYISTQFNPATGGTQLYSQNSAHLSAYVGTNIANAIPIGTFDGGTRRAYLITSLSGVEYFRAALNNNNTGDSSTRWSTSNFLMASRTGATNISSYISTNTSAYSGVQATSLPTNTTVGMPNSVIDLLTCNYGGTHTTYLKAGVNVIGATIGSGVTPEVASYMNTDWNDFANKVNGPPMSEAANNVVYGGAVTASNFVLSIPRWKDAPIIWTWGTGGSAPSHAAITGMGVGALGWGANDFADFQSQMGHDITASNPAYYTELHFHLLPLTAPDPTHNRVKLTVVYSGARIGGALFTPITNVLDNILVTNLTHTLVEIDHLSFTNFYPGISGKFWGTVLVSAPTGGTSNYFGAAGTPLLNVDGDFHYPIDSLGSTTDAMP